MALLTIAEAALKLGYSVELIQYFTKNCPKLAEDRKLKCMKAEGQLLIDDKELLDYQRYLSQRWPMPDSGSRPSIPTAIRDDIRQESHHGCAICGLMDNGEIAHIEAVAETLNNSPDNLVYLCPNHHAKYDLGFRPRSNVTIDEVRAAKTLKRMSRQRMMRYEANATKSLHGLIKLIESIEKQLKEESNKVVVEILMTEAKTLLKEIPKMTDAAAKQADKDQPGSAIDKVIAENAPAFAKIAFGVGAAGDKEVRSKMSSVVSRSSKILIEIDEVECPHCGGRGLVGLVGDYCKYCRGDCVVSEDEAKAYDPDKIDEVTCPHCNGTGTYGLNQLLCRFCGGSCVTTEEEAQSYDPDQIDEVDCPHCNGNGRYGRREVRCSYCKGDCVISEAKAKAYDAAQIDEVECPHCEGKGGYGLRDVDCAYCKGDCVVTAKEKRKYNRDKIDEVDCPHCDGRGTSGLNDNSCAYCGGDGFVTASEKETYDPDQIDEIECPHCNGRGTTGLRDSRCKLCDGDCTVSQDVLQAYQEKYGH
jgi:RecJ-like exonuclease